MNRRLGGIKSVRTVWTNDEFFLLGVELQIVSSLLLPFISIAREGGGGSGSGEMSHPQWEYCVEVSQRQHSLHHCVPKEIRVTDFW